MKFKLFGNQLGMSMTEGAVAMGLIGMGALAAASLSGNLANYTQKSEGIVARSQFAAALGSYLYTASGCSELKAAKSSYSTTAQDLILTQWNYMGINRFEGGYNPDGSKKTKTKYFDIAALEAYYEPVAGAPLVKTSLSGSLVDLSKTVLKIKATLKVGNKTYDYFYNIPALVDSASGSLGFCSDEKTVAETCSSIQGAYDPTEPDPTKRCKIAEGCRVKSSFSIYRCSASIEACDNTRFGDVSQQVNKYTNTTSCPAGSVQTLTHSTTWTSRSKVSKKQTDTVTNEMWWYSCLECPAGAP